MGTVVDAWGGTWGGAWGQSWTRTARQPGIYYPKPKRRIIFGDRIGEFSDAELADLMRQAASHGSKRIAPKVDGPAVVEAVRVLRAPEISQVVRDDESDVEMLLLAV